MCDNSKPKQVNIQNEGTPIKKNSFQNNLLKKKQKYLKIYFICENEQVPHSAASNLYAEKYLEFLKDIIEENV